MELTDVEVASLISALCHVDADCGLTVAENILLNRLSKELKSRGYSFSSSEKGKINFMLIDQQLKDI